MLESLESIIRNFPVKVVEAGVMSESSMLMAGKP